MTKIVRKIMSGGQTGTDRGALAAAVILGLDRGGWVPKGWRSEDGAIPEQYRPWLQECYSTAYPIRTELNVKDSDGTLILSLGDLTHDSGSMVTARLARKHGKPCRHFKISPLSTVAVQMARDWISDNRIRILNVAGPRESREPGVQLAARDAIVCMLGGVG